MDSLLIGRKKTGRPKQDGMKTYLELWKNVYEMESGRTDFVEDWMSKDVAIRHRTIADIVYNT
jgi:hypothetical protein